MPGLLPIEFAHFTRTQWPETGGQCNQRLCFRKNGHPDEFLKPFPILTKKTFVKMGSSLATKLLPLTVVALVVLHAVGIVAALDVDLNELLGNGTPSKAELRNDHPALTLNLTLTKKRTAPVNASWIPCVFPPCDPPKPEPLIVVNCGCCACTQPNCQCPCPSGCQPIVPPNPHCPPGCQPATTPNPSGTTTASSTTPNPDETTTSDDGSQSSTSPPDSHNHWKNCCFALIMFCPSCICTEKCHFPRDKKECYQLEDPKERAKCLIGGQWDMKQLMGNQNVGLPSGFSNFAVGRQIADQLKPLKFRPEHPMPVHQPQFFNNNALADDDGGNTASAAPKSFDNLFLPMLAILVAIACFG